MDCRHPGPQDASGHILSIWVPAIRAGTTASKISANVEIKLNHCLNLIGLNLAIFVSAAETSAGQ